MVATKVSIAHLVQFNRDEMSDENHAIGADPSKRILRVRVSVFDLMSCSHDFKSFELFRKLREVEGPTDVKELGFDGYWMRYRVYIDTTTHCFGGARGVNAAIKDAVLTLIGHYEI